VFNDDDEFSTKVKVAFAVGVVATLLFWCAVISVVMHFVLKVW
jgi:hypothetical protein